MEDDAEDRRQTLEIVTDELDRMSRIVDDLVLLAKAERPDFLRPEDLDLAELTRGHRRQGPPLGSDRRWTVAARRGRLRGDRDRLTQAMLNLAANAVAHTQAGDTIEIGGRAVGDRIHLWVADTGEGVSEEDRAAIFDRFRRGRNARRRSEARAWAWPSSRRSPRPTAAPSSLDERGRRRRHLHPRPARVPRRPDDPWEAMMARILIAEDEPRIAAFVEKGLRANGFTTVVVDDGIAAEAMARDEDFDLLILDLGLPDLDGIEVLRRHPRAAASSSRSSSSPPGDEVAAPWMASRAVPTTT